MLADTIFKEAANLLKAVRGELFDVSVVTKFRIISTDSYYLVIPLTLKEIESLQIMLVIGKPFHSGV